MNLVREAAKNLLRLADLPGDPTPVEVPVSELTPGVRRWVSGKFEILRTAGGEAWLFLPLSTWQHPPFAAHMFPRAPEQLTTRIVAQGGAVIPGNSQLGHALELGLGSGVA